MVFFKHIYFKHIYKFMWSIEKLFIAKNQPNLFKFFDLIILVFVLYCIWKPTFFKLFRNNIRYFSVSIFLAYF